MKEGEQRKLRQQVKMQAGEGGSRRTYPKVRHGAKAVRAMKGKGVAKEAVVLLAVRVQKPVQERSREGSHFEQTASRKERAS